MSIRPSITLYLTGLGWVILVTTVVLVLLPSCWHQTFAQRSVAQALNFLPLIAISSLLLGGFILYATFSRLG